MFRHTFPILSQADLIAANRNSSIDDIFEVLRQGLSLDEFAELLLCPLEQYPNLKARLPSMASEQVQRNWTGSAGFELLRQSTAFIREVERGWRTYVSNDLEGLRHAKILDYGCGWGRLARLLYYYTRTDNIYAADPWDMSIDICRECRLPGNFSLVDYVPESLPFADNSMDLIIAFSVFTHLSERTTDKVLAALRNVISDKGLAVMTIRPAEYWDLHQDFIAGFDKEQLKALHDRDGFAFMPHDREAIDGDITYGDTSISLNYIASRWKGWKLLGYDYNLIDPYQLILFLSPA